MLYLLSVSDYIVFSRGYATQAGPPNQPADETTADNDSVATAEESPTLTSRLRSSSSGRMLAKFSGKNSSAVANCSPSIDESRGWGSVVVNYEDPKLGR